MRTMTLSRLAWRATSVAALWMLVPPAAAVACEACNTLLGIRLLGGKHPSAHAAELTRLVKNSGWSGADALLAIAAGKPLEPAGTEAAGVVEGERGSAETANGGPREAESTLAAGGDASALTAAAAPGSGAVSPAAATAAGAAAAPALPPFPGIMARDAKLEMWQTSYVAPGTKPDKKFAIEMREGDVFIGNGVVYSGFTVNGSIPGPTLIADEGDVIEFTVVNRGDLPHGVSIHAAYTQTSKYFGKIPAGETRSLLFKVNHPGVYMYHCAPGGHAIPMHTLLGQYGMLVVRPKTVQFKAEQIIGHPPDVELFLVQHELYTSGKDAVEGHAAYVMFNGKLFRYVESPIKVRPGDFVRVHFLNVGPNLTSTFHIVGIIWDYAYWQGTPTPENTFAGGQTVTAGPSDSWVVDFRVPPDEGNYLIVTHAFGSTTRGAIGILAASKDAPRSAPIMANGPAYSAEEMEQHTRKAVRVISPFKPSTDELADPFELPYGQKKLRVQIIGNSFWPKVATVPSGTTVEWVNEDVFTFSEGEFAGVHDAVTSDAPVSFSSKLLGHGEKWSTVLTKKGEYSYYCTPHPYMQGIIRVK